jgi:hypothetical protein
MARRSVPRCEQKSVPQTWGSGRRKKAEEGRKSLDTRQDYSTSNGHEDGFTENGQLEDGYTVTSSDTASGSGTVTGSDTTTEQSQSSMSVSQAGSFSNDSYGLSSYSFSAQGSDTLTSTSSDTFTWSLSGRIRGRRRSTDPWRSTAAAPSPKR